MREISGKRTGRVRIHRCRFSGQRTFATASGVAPSTGRVFDSSVRHSGACSNPPAQQTGISCGRFCSNRGRSLAWDSGPHHVPPTRLSRDSKSRSPKKSQQIGSNPAATADSASDRVLALARIMDFSGEGSLRANRSCELEDSQGGSVEDAAKNRDPVKKRGSFRETLIVEDCDSAGSRYCSVFQATLSTSQVPHCKSGICGWCRQLKCVARNLPRDHEAHLVIDDFVCRLCRRSAVAGSSFG